MDHTHFIGHTYRPIHSLLHQVATITTNIMSFDVYLSSSSARKYHSTLMMLEPAKQKIIGQLVLVINAWSLRSTPSVAVVISIVGKLSETGKSFKVYYPSPSVPRHVFITRTMYWTPKKNPKRQKSGLKI